MAKSLRPYDSIRAFSYTFRKRLMSLMLTPVAELSVFLIAMVVSMWLDKASSQLIWSSVGKKSPAIDERMTL